MQNVLDIPAVAGWIIGVGFVLGICILFGPPRTSRDVSSVARRISKRQDSGNRKKHRRSS